MVKRNGSLKPLLAHFDTKRPIDWKRIYARKAPLIVEIGFGLGEVLVEKAFDSPANNYVGIEYNWERITKTLKRIDRYSKSEPHNIRILRCDATVALERLFKQRCVDHFYCLFPCPWPKKKHIKHRLFSQGSLRLINSRLKVRGELYIVTDFYPYVEWIQQQVSGTGFSLEVNRTAALFNTKFERKWREEGQEEFFELRLKKKRHINIVPKKDIALKTYTLAHFDPRRFRLKEMKGELTVVFKGLVYDEKQKQALIHTLVAEENLTQHFWVQAKKKRRGWSIKRADGHYFFPTKGIAKALKLIVDSAKAT